MGFSLPFLFLVELPFQAVTPCYPRKLTGVQRLCQSLSTRLVLQVTGTAPAAGVGGGEGVLCSQTSLGTRVIAGLG